jgi:hypothetical protein
MLFDNSPNIYYALLIFERNDSFVGRKIIMDFSSYADKLIIRHVTPDVNLQLFEKFGVDKTENITIFVVVNKKGQKKRYQSLDKYIERLKKDVQQNNGKLYYFLSRLLDFENSNC